MAIACVVLVIGAYCLLDLFATPFQKVSRARVEKFARRQSLPITADNGPQVIRYLATTRRWRGSGLLVSIGATVLGPLVVQVFWPDHAPQNVGVNGLALFVGWFVGAVIAEWRVSTAATAGPWRAAVLEPRRLGDYVRRPSLVVPATACIVLAAFEVFALGFVLARHRDGLAPVLGWIALTVVAGTLVVLVGRRVLLRPQRYADADLIAGDDALRSRSLHVLAGCAVAIAGYLLAGLAKQLTGYSSVLGGGVGLLVALVGGFLAPALGFMIATASVPPVARAVEALPTSGRAA
jgi:hypothetical protein